MAGSQVTGIYNDFPPAFAQTDEMSLAAAATFDSFASGETTEHLTCQIDALPASHIVRHYTAVLGSRAMNYTISDKFIAHEICHQVINLTHADPDTFRFTRSAADGTLFVTVGGWTVQCPIETALHTLSMDEASRYIADRYVFPQLFPNGL